MLNVAYIFNSSKNQKKCECDNPNNPPNCACAFNISKMFEFCIGVVLPCDVYCPNWKEGGVEHKLT